MHNKKKKQHFCITCGKEFFSKNPTDRYCSEECHDLATPNKSMDRPMTDDTARMAIDLMERRKMTLKEIAEMLHRDIKELTDFLTNHKPIPVYESELFKNNTMCCSVPTTRNGIYVDGWHQGNILKN